MSAPAPMAPAPALAAPVGWTGVQSGRRIVIDHAAVAYPLTNPGDLIEVDFDVHQFAGDGDYLLQRTETDPSIARAAGPTWTGVRSIARTPTGLQVRETARDGAGWTWTPLTDAALAKVRVLGKVVEVYRRQRVRDAAVSLVGRVQAVRGEGQERYVHIEAGMGRSVLVVGLSDTEMRALAPLVMQQVRLELAGGPLAEVTR